MATTSSVASSWKPAVANCVDLFHDSGMQFGGAEMAMAGECGRQTLLLELFLVAVSRFGDTIGIEQQPVAAVQGHFPSRVFSVREHAKDQTRGVQRLDFAVRPREKRRIVAGVGVGEARPARRRAGDTPW